MPDSTSVNIRRKASPKRNALPIIVGDDRATLQPTADLSSPRPFRAIFPILLDGEQLVTSPEHLGVGYLVAVLRASGAECRVVEVPASGLDEALDEMVAWDPDLVGVTMTTVSAAHAKEFGDAMRQRLSPSAFIVGGGPLATFRGVRLLELPGWEFLDAIVRGEGEVPVLRLAEALHAKRDLTAVPNLVHRESGSIVENPITAAIHDLDSIPFPARDQFELHGARQTLRFQSLRVSTSRGCTSFCTFCDAPHARNRMSPTPIWRGASPRSVVDELEMLVDRYGMSTFTIVDSTYEDPGGTSKAKARIAEIAQEIIDRKLQINYGCCMQALNWSDADHDLLDLLWHSGLDFALVGIESGSETDLELWKKRSTVDDNTGIIRLLRSHNIYVLFGFISFHPYTTFETLRANHDFLHENDVAYSLQRLIAQLELYEGAEIIETLRRDDLLLPSFDIDCDEFGYRFEDDRIGDLAGALRLLYGPAYHQHQAFKGGPWEFEAEDNAIGLTLSRLLRRYGEVEEAAAILERAATSLAGLRRSIGEFNFELVGRFVDAAEEGRLRRSSVREGASEFAAVMERSITEVRAIRLRTAVQLQRRGYILDATGEGIRA